MAYHLEQLNILLIEDDASIRALTQDMLYAFGISNIQTAQEGSRPMPNCGTFRPISC